MEGARTDQATVEQLKEASETLEGFVPFFVLSTTRRTQETLLTYSDVDTGTDKPPRLKTERTIFTDHWENGSGFAASAMPSKECDSTCLDSVVYFMTFKVALGSPISFSFKRLQIVMQTARVYVAQPLQRGDRHSTIKSSWPEPHALSCPS